MSILFITCIYSSPFTKSKFLDLQVTIKEKVYTSDSNLDCHSTLAFKNFGQEICKFFNKNASFEEFVQFCTRSDHQCVHDENFACLVTEDFEESCMRKF